MGVLLAYLPERRGPSLAARLLHANVALAQLRVQFRLCHDWQLITPGQFEHGVKLMDEVGRLLSAWLKASKNAAAR